jgi:hypothetical protein
VSVACLESQFRTVNESEHMEAPRLPGAISPARYPEQMNAFRRR